MIASQESQLFFCLIVLSLCLFAGAQEDEVGIKQPFSEPPQLDSFLRTISPLTRVATMTLRAR